MLTQKPTFAISLISNLPVPKTIAFGGVPTGSIYAQFAAIAAGTMSNNGCTFTATDNVARIGKIIVAVAVLDVISVKNNTNKVITMTMSNGLTPSSNVSCSPNQLAKPLEEIPSLRQGPHQIGLIRPMVIL